MRRHLSAVFIVLAVVALGGRERAAVGIKPGPFKMLELDGGSLLPAAGPIIKVPYDRIQRRYIQIQQQPLSLRMTVTATCGGIKFRELTVSALGEKLPVDTSTIASPGGGFNGATTLTTDKLTTAALASVVPDPIDTCNGDLESMVKQGQHGKAQKGWVRRFENVLPLQVLLVCRDDAKRKLGFEDVPYSAPKNSARSSVWLHCGPAAVFKPMDAADRPGPKAKKSGGAPIRTSPPAAGGRRGQAPLPDLVISSAQPVPSAPAGLRLEVSNIGGAASAATRLTVFYHRSGHVVKKSFAVPALGAGQSRWIAADLGSPIAHAEQVTARVNDSGNVTEADLTNNTITIK